MEIGAANGDPGEDKLLRRAAAGGSQAAATATAMAWRRVRLCLAGLLEPGPWTSGGSGIGLAGLPVSLRSLGRLLGSTQSRANQAAQPSLPLTFQLGSPRLSIPSLEALEYSTFEM